MTHLLHKITKYQDRQAFAIGVYPEQSSRSFPVNECHSDMSPVNNSDSEGYQCLSFCLHLLDMSFSDSSFSTTFVHILDVGLLVFHILAYGIPILK